MAGDGLTPRRHPTGTGWWEMTLARPAGHLRHAVRDYCDYTEHTDRPILRRELPQAQVVVILNFGVPFRILDRHHPGRSRTVGSFAAGVHDQHTVVCSSGTARCVQLNLTPIGAARLLGLPLGELTNQVVDLPDLLPAADRHLPERLHAAGTPARRFALLDDWIGRRFTHAAGPSAPLLQAWERLRTHHGQYPIGGLAAELGWSRRHLATRFREALGLPPKAMARLLRFERAVALLERDPAAGWADVAARAGYFDQSHFALDCRALADCTPTVLREERQRLEMLPAGG
jgi:AraC-like DNA-binding protein